MNKKELCRCLISCFFLLLGMLCLSFLLLNVLSLFVWRSDGNVKLAGGGVIAIYVIVTLFGGFMMGRIWGRQKFFWGLLVGLLYFGILLSAGILFAGTTLQGNSRIFPGVMICMISGMLGGMLAPVPEKQG